MWRETRILILKEINLEWRNKYALNGLILYVFAMVFLVYISFTQIQAQTWNALFWIILFFASVNGVAKSFMLESQHRNLYYFSLAGPLAIFFSKLIYNILLLFILGLMCLGAMSLLATIDIANVPFFILALGLGCIGFSLTLTLTSAIASKANNRATLMAVLSFPLIIPILVLLIKLSLSAISGDAISAHVKDILILLAIDLIIASLAYILFPYLWKD